MKKHLVLSVLAVMCFAVNSFASTKVAECEGAGELYILYKDVDGTYSLTVNMSFTSDAVSLGKGMKCEFLKNSEGFLCKSKKDGWFTQFITGHKTIGKHYALIRVDTVRQKTTDEHGIVHDTTEFMSDSTLLNAELACWRSPR